MPTFKAVIEIIGINPFVFVPENILAAVLQKAGKAKGPIPIKGVINKTPYRQTLVKYAGHWRLYINTIMLKDSPKRVGEAVTISIAFDPADRKLKMHPQLEKALAKNKIAKDNFQKLPASRQQEIIRYISNLKTAESVERNIAKAINFLSGTGSFVGRQSL
ncbi:YdeI/OmpD-associated family protein [Lacibacter sediminis]|uniref:YdeI/OmpD-associated family protein n=1 Tax=Lacibacter sediminis TaxID=2760713 RepID=A0A7G5XIY3_9BACT|nr:YdeI/OmpD-associated family protein [Lacibacter sediminis]QNA45436.1 YdeI/OmpD-associated family protein [Lacibacter sediminis]